MNLCISPQEPRLAEGERRRPCFPAGPRVEGSVRYAVLLLLAVLLVWGPVAGCSNSRYLKVRKAPKNPLEGPLNLLSRKGPQPTERTLQTLRRYDLEKLHAKEDLDATLIRLQEEIRKEPTADKLHAFSELAYIAAYKADAVGNDAPR